MRKNVAIVLINGNNLSEKTNLKTKNEMLSFEFQ